MHRVVSAGVHSPGTDQRKIRRPKRDQGYPPRLAVKRHKRAPYSGGTPGGAQSSWGCSPPPPPPCSSPREGAEKSNSTSTGCGGWFLRKVVLGHGGGGVIAFAINITAPQLCPHCSNVWILHPCVDFPPTQHDTRTMYSSPCACVCVCAHVRRCVWGEKHVMEGMCLLRS